MFHNKQSVKVYGKKKVFDILFANEYEKNEEVHREKQSITKQLNVHEYSFKLKKSGLFYRSRIDLHGLIDLGPWTTISYSFC